MKKSINKGFTLLELMVLVGMLGIVAAVGVPSLRMMLVTNEVVEATNGLVTILKRARSEAINHGQDVRVCSTTDGKQCTTSSWARGYLVYVDLDNDGQVDEADNELIRVYMLSSKTQITIAPVNVMHAANVDFSYKGILSAEVVAQFNICSGFATDGFPRREISVSVSGDVSLNKNTAVLC